MAWLLSRRWKTSEGTGACDAADKDGDRWSIWWVDTPRGHLGVTHGTGKFAGMTGGGTDTSAFSSMTVRS